MPKRKNTAEFLIIVVHMTFCKTQFSRNWMDRRSCWVSLLIFIEGCIVKDTKNLLILSLCWPGKLAQKFCDADQIIKTIRIPGFRHHIKSFRIVLEEFTNAFNPKTFIKREIRSTDNGVRSANVFQIGLTTTPAITITFLCGTFQISYYYQYSVCYGESRNSKMTVLGWYNKEVHPTSPSRKSRKNAPITVT